MNIFITGIAGFLGSHLADHFLNLGHNVFGNDNLIGGSKKNINKKVEFFLVDCCDFEKIKKITKNIDCLIHCAASAHEGLSIFSPNFICKNNFQASTSVISCAAANKVKRIVYCSSMARYGKNKTPFFEDYECKPVDPYGISKVAGEEILKNICEVNNLEWNIVVPHNIYGPRQKYDDPYRNVVSIMINRNLQNKPSIIYGNGNQTRCFSYIDDCIESISKICLNKNVKKQIFNIGPDESVITIKKLAKIISKLCNFNGNPIFVKKRKNEVKEAYCSSEKARKYLNYITKTKLEDGIKKNIEYIKKEGVKKFKYYIPIEINNNFLVPTWEKNFFNT